tara:strand:- start:29103 stop:29405 length:303 start_codon:yes stop_codon:yes gene_type:complete
MKRFDVFAVNDPTGVRAVLVVQGDFYLDLESVVVVPLYDADRVEVFPHINLRLEINDETLILKTEEMTAAPRAVLQSPIANLESRAFEIQNAIDRLVSGY